MLELTGFCISRFDQLTHPRATWFSDIVFDQGARIKIIQSHTALVTTVTDGLAQRRVESQVVHATDVTLLLFFRQAFPLSGQTAFFGGLGCALTLRP